MEIYFIADQKFDLSLRRKNWNMKDCYVLWFQTTVQSSVKPAVSALFGEDDDDDDLFGSAKPKAPPVIQFFFFYKHYRKK